MPRSDIYPTTFASASSAPLVVTVVQKRSYNKKTLAPPFAPVIQPSTSGLFQKKTNKRKAVETIDTQLSPATANKRSKITAPSLVTPSVVALRKSARSKKVTQ